MSNIAFSRLLSIVCCTAYCIGGTSAFLDAQSPAARSGALPISPAEAAFQLRFEAAKHASTISYTQAKYPKDSLQNLVSQSAQQWLDRLRTTPVSGLQVDPHGTITVVARKEALAKQEFDTRATTPGLSINDRAYTYHAAVVAFADADIPERLPAAEAYMQALDSLGSAAAYWRFTAHRTLQEVYYVMGRSADVARHGMCAIALADTIPFFARSATVYSPENAALYDELLDALSGQPDGRAKIERANAMLLAGTTPDAALIASDSSVVWESKYYTTLAHNMIRTGARIGTRGQDIEGNYWVNLTPGVGRAETHTLSISSGRITVMEVGSFTCAGCVTSLAGVQRLQRRFPMLQTVFTTWTLGFWGNRLVEPLEEATHLAEQFTTRNKITDVPLSIWMGKKVTTADDGVLPENEGPNLAHYPMVSKPNLYIFDGKGTIRVIHLGSLERDTEARFARTIEFLLKEAAQGQSSPQHAEQN